MSSPKAPTKSAEQTALEEAQLAEYNKQIAAEQEAVASRKAEIKRGSIGRRSLITTSETGTSGIGVPSTNTGNN